MKKGTYLDIVKQYVGFVCAKYGRCYIVLMVTDKVHQLRIMNMRGEYRKHVWMYSYLNQWKFT